MRGSEGEIQIKTKTKQPRLYPKDRDRERERALGAYEESRKVLEKGRSKDAQHTKVSRTILATQNPDVGWDSVGTSKGKPGTT